LDADEADDVEAGWEVYHPSKNAPADTARGLELIKWLRELGVTTLVVDECHHLRREWWRVIERVRGELGKPTVVALTATPPYDVAKWEWKHFESLCGPVDAEIPIPALVAAGDLCPHQDNVILSRDDEVSARSAVTAAQFSTEKLESMREIIAVEREVSGEDLRLAILTDYIRRPKVGALAVFEHLRGSEPEDLGLLSGSVVVIPASARERFCAEVAKAATGLRIRANQPTLRKAGVGYLKWEVGEATRPLAVRAMTALLAAGVVRVLVGTNALLGEGWDAPCLNALIIASTVGSFVLSNQVRGRALRIDPDCPDKVARIWHLATMPAQGAGPEYYLLKRRFETFVCISHTAPVIASGIRQVLDDDPPEDIISSNATQYSRCDPQEIRDRWRQALAAGGAGALVPVVRVSGFPSRVKPTGWSKSEVVSAATVSAMAVLITVLAIVGWAPATQVALCGLMGAGIGGVVGTLGRRAAWKSLLETVAKAVLRGLKGSHPKDFRTAEVFQAGDSFGLNWATVREQEIFRKAMQAAVNPGSTGRLVVVKAGFPLHRQAVFAVPKGVSVGAFTTGLKGLGKVTVHRRSSAAGQQFMAEASTPQAVERAVVWRTTGPDSPPAITGAKPQG
jgi:hypothetical protein